MFLRFVSRFARPLISAHDTPKRLALAFTMGVFFSLTPFVGLHTIVALALAFSFGLNRAAVVFGLLLNNPWTLVPYYTAASYLGGWLIGFPEAPSLAGFRLAELWQASFWSELAGQWRLLIPMALGSTILAILGAALAYPLALYVIRRGRAVLRPSALELKG
jgi:uncharacterized protein (DUF2062 family)